MKKRIFSCILSAILVMGLASCGSDDEGSSSGSASKSNDSNGSAETTTITYYTWETSEQTNPVWQEIEDELNIKVEVCVLPDTGGTDKESALDIVAMSGSEMDFRIITSSQAATRVEKGFALELTDLIEKHDVDMEDLFGKYCEFVQFNGAYYGIPCRGNVNYWFYNKNIFDELNLDYPQDGWTWDEYYALADKITQESDYFGTCTNAHPGMWYNNGLEQGGQFFDANGKFNFLNDEKLINSMENYYRMDQEGVKPSFVSMRSRNSYVSTEFLSGNCAMAEGWPYILRDMRLPDQFPFDFEVGVVTPPVNSKGDPSVSLLNVEFLAVNPASEHPEEAFLAMTYYMEHGAKYVAGLTLPPTTKVDDELIEAFVEGTPISKEDGAKFFDESVELVAMNPWGNYENGQEYKAIVNEEAEVYFTGGQDLDTTLSNIDKRAKELEES